MKPYYNFVDIAPVRGLAHSPVDEALTPEFFSELVNIRLTEKPGFYAVRDGVKALLVDEKGSGGDPTWTLDMDPYTRSDLGNIYTGEIFFKDIFGSRTSSVMYWSPRNIYGPEAYRTFARKGLLLESVPQSPPPPGGLWWLPLWVGRHGNMTVGTNGLSSYTPSGLPAWDRLIVFAQRKYRRTESWEDIWRQEDWNGIVDWSNSRHSPLGTVLYLTNLSKIENSTFRLECPTNTYLAGSVTLAPVMGMGFIHSSDWSWVSPNISFSYGIGTPSFYVDYDDRPRYVTGDVHDPTYWYGESTTFKWSLIVSHPHALQTVVWRSENGKVVWEGYNIGDYILYDISDKARELQYDEPHVLIAREISSGRVDPAVLGFDIRTNDENKDVEAGLALYKYYLPKKYGKASKDHYKPTVVQWEKDADIPYSVRKLYPGSAISGGGGSADSLQKEYLWQFREMSAEWILLMRGMVLVETLLSDEGHFLPGNSRSIPDIRLKTVLHSRAIWGDERPLVTGWTGRNHIGDDFWIGGLSRTMMVDKDLHYVFTTGDFTSGFYDLFGQLSLRNPDVDPVSTKERDGTGYRDRILDERAADVYVWSDYRVKYNVVSGRVWGLGLLTHYDRTWNKDKPIAPKNFPIKEPDRGELLSPVAGWYYRVVYEYEDGTFSNPSPPIAAPHLLWGIFTDEEIVALTNGKRGRPVQPNIVDGTETVAGNWWRIGKNIYNQTGSYGIELPVPHWEGNPPVATNYWNTAFGKFWNLWRDIRRRLYPSSSRCYPSEQIVLSDNPGVIELAATLPLVAEELQMITLYSDHEVVWCDGTIGEGFAWELLGDGADLRVEDAKLVLRNAKSLKLAIPLVPQPSFVGRNALFTSKGFYRYTIRRASWVESTVDPQYGGFGYYATDWWNQRDYTNAAGVLYRRPLELSLDEYWDKAETNNMRYETNDPGDGIDYRTGRQNVIRTWNLPQQVYDVYFDENGNPRTDNEAELIDYANRVASSVPNSYIQLVFQGQGHTLSPPSISKDTNYDEVFIALLGDENSDDYRGGARQDWEEFQKGWVSLWSWNTKDAIIDASDWAEEYNPTNSGRAVELEIFSVVDPQWDSLYLSVVTPQWDADGRNGEIDPYSVMPSVIRLALEHKDRFSAVKDDVPPQVLDRLILRGVAELHIVKSRFESQDPTNVSFASERKTFGAWDNNIDGTGSESSIVRTYHWDETDYYLPENNAFYLPYRTANVPHIKSRWVPVSGGHTLFYTCPKLKRSPDEDDWVNDEDTAPGIVTMYSRRKDATAREYMFDGSIWHIWNVHTWVTDGEHNEWINDNRHLYIDHVNWYRAIYLYTEGAQAPLGQNPYPFYPLPAPHRSVWTYRGTDWHIGTLQERNYTWQLWNYVPTQMYYFAYAGDWGDDYEVRWNRPYINTGDYNNDYWNTELQGSLEHNFLSYGIPDLWYSEDVATRDNIDIVVYLEGERLTLLEQLTAYFTSYHLFNAPRLGLWFDRRLIPPRVRKIHIYRSRCLEANEWHPEEYGYVTTLDVQWKWDPEERKWTLDEDPYYFDDTPDTAVDYSDNPSKYNSIEYGLSSLTNMVLSERVYYANFKERYLPMPTTPFNTMWNGQLGVALLDPIRWGAIVDIDQSIGQSQYIYREPPPTDSPALFPGLRCSYVSGETWGIPDDIPFYFTMNVDGSGYYSNVWRSPLLPGFAVLPPTFNSDTSNYTSVTFWGLSYPIEDLTSTLLWRGKDVYGTTPLTNYRWRTAAEIEPTSAGTCIDRGTDPKIRPELLHDWIWVRVEPYKYDADDVFLATPYTIPVIQEFESSIRWSDIGQPSIIRSSSIENIREGDGGKILAIVPTYHGNILAFKENSVVRLMLAGDFTIARRDQISDNIGMICPGACVTVGNFVFFASKSGIYVTDDNTVQDITGPIAETYKNLVGFLLSGSPSPARGLVRLFHNPIYNEVYVNIPIVPQVEQIDPQINTSYYNRQNYPTLFVYSIEQKTWTTFVYTTIENAYLRTNITGAWQGYSDALLAQPYLHIGRNFYYDSYGRIWSIPLAPSNLNLGGQLYLEGPHPQTSIWASSIDDFFVGFDIVLPLVYDFDLSPDDDNLRRKYVRAYLSSSGLREMITIKKKVREFAGVFAWKVQSNILVSSLGTTQPWEADYQAPYIRMFMGVRIYGLGGQYAYLPEYRGIVGEWYGNQYFQTGELWVVPGGIRPISSGGDRGEVVRFHVAIEGPALFKGWKVAIREAETYSR